MCVKRRIFKKEVKKEIPGLWAWKLLEKKCQRKRPGEDLVAFLICQSVDMDIICCHTSQKKEWYNLVFSRLVGLCSFWWISVCLYRSCRGVSKLIYGKSTLLMVFTVRTPCIWKSHRIWVRSNTVKSRFCCAALWIQEWALKLACLLAVHKGLVVTYHASHVSSFCTVSREGINISLYSNSCILVYAQILQLSPAFCLLGKYLCLTGWRARELV